MASEVALGQTRAPLGSFTPLPARARPPRACAARRCRRVAPANRRPRRETGSPCTQHDAADTARHQPGDDLANGRSCCGPGWRSSRSRCWKGGSTPHSSRRCSGRGGRGKNVVVRSGLGRDRPGLLYLTPLKRPAAARW